MPEPLWTPSPQRVASAALTEFRTRAQQRVGRPLTDYDALHRWSVSDPAAFWALLAEDEALPFRSAPTRIRSDDPMPHTRWFEGATLSYARALLYPGAPGDDDLPAVIGVTEAGDEVHLDRGRLRSLVAQVQAGLRRSGVTAGDAVAAYAANLPETVALLVACSGMGVLFASCSPDFGQAAAEARFAQLRPKLLFASTLYRYGGKRFDTAATVAALAAGSAGLTGVVVLPYPGESPVTEGVGMGWAEWLAGSPTDTQPETVALPFDHPLYVLFSSGTTGVPKAMVHRAGGVLLTHHKEHRLHGDVHEGDVVFYFTTCGWMMWNWLVSALAEGATIVLYEGSPAHPDLHHLWRVAERLGITFFGTSARFLHTLQSQGARPAEQVDLSRLRTLASTGSPLSPAGFRFVYQHVKRDLHLASISGGTDIVSCFMLGVPTLPVFAGQIQRPGLGVDLAVFDDEGHELFGEPGEMVCRRPLPSMPLRFLDDPDGRRYHEAYFETYDGVWRHGDLIERTVEGGVIVYGRSDATLNPGGVRIGTAEVYRPLEALPEIGEAVAVGKRGHGDEEIWLLVVLQAGVVLDEALEGRIRGAIRRESSPRHVPRRILQVAELPRTRSGKSMEIAVRCLVNGQAVPNPSVVANPESLDAIWRVLAALD